MTSRREFLRGSLGLGGVLLLTACGTPAPVSPAAPAATPPPASVAPAQTTPPAAVAASSAASSAPVQQGASGKPMTLEQELALPASLLDAATREGKFTWMTSVDKPVAAKVGEAFKARYPMIQPTAQEGSEEVRTVRTLAEFQAGKTQTDVIMGIGGFMNEYKAAKALTSLTDLPAYPQYEPPYRDSEGEWVGARTQFWAFGYNTDHVKDSDVPKTWEELTQPQWRGRIGLGDRPQLWVEQRWKEWGPDRTRDFLQKLFANKPQRRKEGLDASANLLAAGEFDLYVPAAPYRIEGLRQQGATVGWASPDPVAAAASELVILQKCPNPNAARVFVNWFMSQEGQNVYCRADNATPTNVTLRADKSLLGMYADSLLAHQWAFLAPEDEPTILPQVRQVWAPLWTS